MFWILLFAGFPILFFALMEMGLRLYGYGYPTRFFLESERNGRKVLVENPRFGFRFFPPGMARSPAPIVMPAEKLPNTFRIFVFGESAALGDPKAAYGMSRYLELLLDERYPEARFEVICVAITAINSHVIRQIARECRKYDGDFWVVYMGNNELMGRFGAAGPLGQNASSLFTVRASLALKSTRFGQWLDAGLQRLGGQGDPSAWKGLQHFADNQVAPDDPIRSRVAEQFSANLRDILQLGANAGVQTILCTVASNLKHCAPHASLHRSGLDENDRTPWNELYQRGIEAQSSGEVSDALGHYLQAAQLDGRHAELQFRTARIHQILEQMPEARAAYELARDCDALPFRTTSALNEIIRRAAADGSGRGVTLLEVEALMAEAASDQIPGNDLFFDHVHFNFEGNYLLARAVAGKIANLLPDSVAATGDWLASFDCELRLGLTAWNRYLAIENMLSRLSQAPYTNQWDNIETRRRHARTFAQLRQHMQESNPAQVAAIYEEALAQKPADYFLVQNYAEFLEMSGKLSAATDKWKEVVELIPHYPVAHFHVGRLLVRQNQFEAAEPPLRRALSIRSDFPDALIELGKALAGRGTHEEAMQLYAEALRFDPENAMAHFQTAESLGARNRHEEAMDHLRETIQLRPGHWEARYLLGVELAIRDQYDEAIEQFQEVVRLRPDHALACFNLGVALAKERRIPEAALAFEKTLELDPNHKAAREYLQALKSVRSRGE